MEADAGKRRPDHSPIFGPTTEFPDRKRPCFEVVESISTGSEEDEEELLMSANRALVLETIAEMKALPAPVNDDYRLVHVMNDEDGRRADFEFDATITEDDVEAGEYVLTAGGGGFRLSDL